MNVSSVIKPKNEYADVILVLDTSGSMNEAKLLRVKDQTIGLINKLLPKGSNIALITFNDSSEIVTDFTNDSTVLTDSINGLTAVGNTNYYQALVNVENILKNYTHEENRDCVVLFLTDGLPNIDTPNEVAQYQNLKANYSYLTINGVQYEMGNDLVEALKTVSDNQYITNIDTLDNFLYQATVSPVPYENFEIIDYIESNYFTVSDIFSITITLGTVSLDGNKISWNLDGILTGMDATMTIDVNLRDELIGVGGIYPTNEKLEVNSVIGDSNESVSSTLTPILADNYQINYEGNAPDDCSVTRVPSPTKASVFDTISVSTEVPSCEGYQFKGWELVTEGVNRVNDSYFIMPEDNVTIRATWSKLSLAKSTEGKVSQIQSLYQMMADNSVPDNVASQYVTSSTGINFNANSSDTNGKGIYQAVKLEGENTPIYYYRGDVTNNNLIFANFCWKIVRTTATKGVKLIYNGVPNEDGSCTATGANVQIGASTFSGPVPFYTSYMYGAIYNRGDTSTSIAGIGGKNQSTKRNINATNYIYSSTVTYDETTGLYTLVDGENRVWNDTYSVGSGNQYLYTCLSETETSCSSVYYTIRSTSADNIDYVVFTEGETAEDILNKELVYGNDVTYDETTGMYTLVTTMISKVSDFESDRTIIGGENGYHYTCLNESGTCSTVKYIYYTTSAAVRNTGSIYYLALNNSKNIDDAVREMTTESTNTTDSKVKIVIDNWYKNNMVDYTEMLEDTTWCNDRTIWDYGAFDKDGNANATYLLSYQVRYDLDSGIPSLKCRNQNDAFTVEDKLNGNGALTYPIALLSADEVRYAGGRYSNNSYYLYTGTSYWTMSPLYIRSVFAFGYCVETNGYLVYLNAGQNAGVRPAVSLKAGTRSIDGNGTAEDPFIVLTD